MLYIYGNVNTVPYLTDKEKTGQQKDNENILDRVCKKWVLSYKKKRFLYKEAVEIFKTHCEEKSLENLTLKKYVEGKKGRGKQRITYLTNLYYIYIYIWRIF